VINILTPKDTSMRLREFNPVPSVAAATSQAADVSKWAKYGPGVLTAAEQLAKGHPTTALITALRTAAPTMHISHGVHQGLETIEGLEMLSTIVRNPAALGTFLATFSRGAGEGEDLAVQRERDRIAQMGASNLKK
jgi:hypothetical protein